MTDSRLAGSEAIDSLLSELHQGAVSAEGSAPMGHSIFRVGDWAVVHRAGFWRSTYGLIVRTEGDEEFTEYQVEGEPVCHLIALFHPRVMMELVEGHLADATRPGDPRDASWEAKGRELEDLARRAEQLRDLSCYTPVLWSELPKEYLDFADRGHRRPA